MVQKLNSMRLRRWISLIQIFGKTLSMFILNSSQHISSLSLQKPFTTQSFAGYFQEAFIIINIFLLSPASLLTISTWMSQLLTAILSMMVSLKRL